VQGDGSRDVGGGTGGGGKAGERDGGTGVARFGLGSNRVIRLFKSRYHLEASPLPIITGRALRMRSAEKTAERGGGGETGRGEEKVYQSVKSGE